jgi:phosphinothricin acetyltransferase
VDQTINIREVSADDAAAITAIYAHHVLNGTASYEIKPPSVHETLAKIGRITEPGWPFIVAVMGGEVVGYAYATQFRDRPAYRFACENSIYVHPSRVGQGIGRILLSELCDRCEAFGFRQIVAVVGGAEPASIALHERCGFERVGRLRAMGWKHGRWLDTVYLQRSLGVGSSQPGEGPPRE